MIAATAFVRTIAQADNLNLIEDLYPIFTQMFSSAASNHCTSNSSIELHTSTSSSIFIALLFTSLTS